LQIVEDFGVDVRSGLSASRVASSLSEFGRNELPEAEEEPLWQKFVAKLKEPMIALLLTSAGVSLLTGQYDDAVSIALVRAGPSAGAPARHRRAPLAGRSATFQRAAAAAAAPSHPHLHPTLPLHFPRRRCSSW
jgi:hypothetical protein